MKKIRIISLFIIVIMIFSSISVQASDIGIDTQNAKEGIVRVSYIGTNKKMKVMVEKGSTKYFYDMKNEEEFFPLQFGQGSYTVAVLENISGNEYKVLTKKSFKADITEKNLVYLKSAQPILWDEDDEAIKLANELTKGVEEDEEIVQAIYDYIVNNINYDYTKISGLSNDYIPEIDKILEEGSGICYDYSVLFAAMLRSQGVATKLIKGYKNDIESYHAWNEVYLNGNWKIVDTTYDAWALKHRTSHNIYKNKNEYKTQKEY
ncbi:MAG: transglutaminase-like domain-containing protein [Firmicutes bacterium]|nr:transglutaminase-like domain-containing protein [Bacillota bacterium]